MKHKKQSFPSSFYTSRVQEINCHPYSKNLALKERTVTDGKMGSLRFELKTSAMSRRRHNQLDHEPV